MSIAILGCGPAGLLAAHAAHLMHIESRIYAIKQPSVINGAQFLHAEIPHLEMGMGALVNFRKVGTKEGYAKKVYGDELAPVSWDLFGEGDQPAWPMHDVYNTLWQLYGGFVEDKRLYPHDVAPLQSAHDLVISTIPRMMLCLRKHSFASQRVLFADRAAFKAAGNFIEYNGDMDTPYYRTSELFGHGSTEFSEVGSWTMHPTDMQQGIKPLSTSCNCHHGVLFVGRFGQWQKGVLVHHAFQEVCDALQRL